MTLYYERLIWDDDTLDVEVLKYANPMNNAIQLWCDEGPFLTASVNVTDELAVDEVAIKTYSENVGVLDALVASGIIAAPHRWLVSAFVLIPVCKLLLKG